MKINITFQNWNDYNADWTDWTFINNNNKNTIIWTKIKKLWWNEINNNTYISREKIICANFGFNLIKNQVVWKTFQLNIICEFTKFFSFNITYSFSCRTWSLFSFSIYRGFNTAFTPCCVGCLILRVNSKLALRQKNLTGYLVISYGKALFIS